MTFRSLLEDYHGGGGGGEFFFLENQATFGVHSLPQVRLHRGMLAEVLASWKLCVGPRYKIVHLPENCVFFF